jgi:predicted Zn-dependent peptidase
MAHLFEHMMFNGSAAYGPGSFDRLIEGAGGSTNGFTTRDFTVFVNDFPPAALELVLALEADRMRRLLITPENIEQERGIVKEERRLSIDDDPLGTLDEQLYLLAFVASPYRWSTVGFMADLETITLADARAHFDRYYTPGNAVLVLSGDIETVAAQGAVERAFGGIAARAPPRRAGIVEPRQRGARRAEVRMPAELPAVLVGYHAVAAGAPDRAALDVLDVVLSAGESSRLHRRLVYERELATTVWTRFEWRRHATLFEAYVQARPRTAVGDLERGIFDVVAAAGRVPPDAVELAKAKTILHAGLVRGLQTAGGTAHLLGSYHLLFGDYRALLGIDAEWEAVTADDVLRVARRYLRQRNSTTIVLVPERGS